MNKNNTIVKMQKFPALKSYTHSEFGEEQTDKGAYAYHLHLKPIPEEKIKLESREFCRREAKRLFDWMADNLPSLIWEETIELFVEHKEKLKE